MPDVLVFFAVLSASSAGLLCHAQQAQSVTPVRYYFGDNPSGMEKVIAGVEDEWLGLLAAGDAQLIR